MGSAHKPLKSRRRGSGGAHLCVDCRTALGTSSQCDHAPKHRVVSLDGAEGRAAVLREVWGPPSVRRRARQLARAGGGGSGIGAVFEGCGGGCGGCDGVVDPLSLLIVATVGLVVALGYWLVSLLLRKWREHKQRLRPHGALRRPTRFRGPACLVGRVVGGEPLASPASGADTLGYGLELVSREALHHPVTLRLARTEGFEVESIDGDRLVVPAGRFRLRGPRKRVRGRSVAMEVLVDDFDRPFDDKEDLAPFPFDQAREVVVQLGDEIEVFGELKSVATEGDAGGAQGPYRTRAARRLHAVGVVDVRIRRRARD